MSSCKTNIHDFVEVRGNVRKSRGMSVCARARVFTCIHACILRYMHTYHFRRCQMSMHIVRGHRHTKRLCVRYRGHVRRHRLRHTHRQISVRYGRARTNRVSEWHGTILQLNCTAFMSCATAQRLAHGKTRGAHNNTRVAHNNTYAADKRNHALLLPSCGAGTMQVA
jgi:hypothetical protein